MAGFPGKSCHLVAWWLLRAFLISFNKYTHTGIHLCRVWLRVVFGFLCIKWRYTVPDKNFLLGGVIYCCYICKPQLPEQVFAFEFSSSYVSTARISLAAVAPYWMIFLRLMHGLYVSAVLANAAITGIWVHSFYLLAETLHECFFTEEIGRYFQIHIPSQD